MRIERAFLRGTMAALALLASLPVARIGKSHQHGIRRQYHPAHIRAQRRVSQFPDGQRRRRVYRAYRQARARLVGQLVHGQADRGRGQERRQADEARGPPTSTTISTSRGRAYAQAGLSVRQEATGNVKAAGTNPFSDAELDRRRPARPQRQADTVNLYYVREFDPATKNGSTLPPQTECRTDELRRPGRPGEQHRRARTGPPAAQRQRPLEGGRHALRVERHDQPDVPGRDGVGERPGRRRPEALGHRGRARHHRAPQRRGEGDPDFPDACERRGQQPGLRQARQQQHHPRRHGRLRLGQRPSPDRDARGRRQRRRPHCRRRLPRLGDRRHPGQPHKGPANDDHVHGGLGTLALGKFADEFFKTINVISNINLFADNDINTATGIVSDRSKALDYFVPDFSLDGITWEAGELVNVFIKGWTEATTQENYVGRFRTNLEAKFVRISAVGAGIVGHDGNAQIDAIIATRAFVCGSSRSPPPWSWPPPWRSWDSDTAGGGGRSPDRSYKLRTTILGPVDPPGRIGGADE